MNELKDLGNQAFLLAYKHVEYDEKYKTRNPDIFNRLKETNQKIEDLLRQNKEDSPSPPLEIPSNQRTGGTTS